MEEVNKVKPVIVTSDYEFFEKWLILLYCGINLHNSGESNFKLTPPEMGFLAALLTERHKLAAVILDEEILTNVLFSKETKDKIVAHLGYKTVQEFENKAYSLRKKNVILENNRIAKPFIPKVNKDLSEYNLQFTLRKGER